MPRSRCLLSSTGGRPSWAGASRRTCWSSASAIMSLTGTRHWLGALLALCVQDREVLACVDDAGERWSSYARRATPSHEPSGRRRCTAPWSGTPAPRHVAALVDEEVVSAAGAAPTCHGCEAVGAHARVAGQPAVDRIRAMEAIRAIAEQDDEVRPAPEDHRDPLADVQRAGPLDHGLVEEEVVDRRASAGLRGDEAGVRD